MRAAVIGRAIGPGYGDQRRDRHRPRGASSRGDRRASGRDVRLRGEVFRGTIAVVDTAANAVVATVGVSPGPLSLAVHPAGTFVYVAHDGPEVTVIDTAGRRVVATIPVGWAMDAAARGIAVHPAGTFVYVANEFDASVSVISTATHAVVDVLTTAGRPAGIAVHPDGRFLYVAHSGFLLPSGNAAMDGHNLMVIDTKTHAVAATVPIEGFPSGVAVHPAGTFVFVTNPGSSSVSVVATATNTVVATHSFAAFPHGVAVHPAGTFVYVGHPGQGMSVIDTVTHAVVASVAAPGAWAFGPFVGPRHPGVSLTLDGTSVRAGDALTLVATTYPGDRGDPVDAYLEARLPDGSVLFAQPDGSFITDRRPLAGRWAVEPIRRTLLQHTVTGAEPIGVHAWRSYFTEPGTPDVIGVVSEIRFTVASPTQEGQHP